MFGMKKGKRGSCEVGSSLIHYIENHVPESVTKLVIFIDNCSGQNKNLNLCLLCLRYIQRGRFGMIKHYFLVSGHSFLPCDRDFGHVEKALKGKDVFTTPHYIEFMKKCREKNPFEVVEMGPDKFYDLQVLQQVVTKTSLARAGFKDARVFAFKYAYKQGMGIQSNYGLLTEKYIKLQKGRGNVFHPSKFFLPGIALPLKYPDGVLLQPEKLKDLKYLCKFVSPEHMPFYNDLFKKQADARAKGGVVRDDPVSGPDDDFLDY